MLVVLIALALIFDFLNGFHDSSNVVATVIASRAMHPRLALFMAAIGHLVGPFLFGVAVASTIGEDLLDSSALNMNVIVAALFSAVIWNILTWYFGLPSSSSHALMGGLLGSSVLSSGVHVVQMPGLVLILVALFVSPPLGMLAGFIVMRITLWSVRKSTPKASGVFRRLQILTLIGLSLSHGANDAQKTMGVISLGLLLAGKMEAFAVPVWVIALSASAIALGTSIGGWRLIRTLGYKIVRIRPVHGFTSQVAGAAVILGAALVGGPVSTTQVISSAIIGVGAAERVNKVRWTVLGDLVISWLLTIPATAALAALVQMGLSMI